MKNLLLVLIFFAFSLSLQAQFHKRPGLIIMHDGAEEDTAALILVLASQQFDIRSIVVTPGNCHKLPAIRTTQKLLAYFNYSNVPIATSNEYGTHPFPDEWKQHSIDISNFSQIRQMPMDPSNRLVPEPAFAHLVRMLSQNGPYQVLVTGPLSDLALALKQQPAIRQNISHIYIMGGAVHVPGNVRPHENHDGSAEWNLYNNPAAASMVIESGIPVTLVSLDGTNQTPLKLEFLTSVGKLHTPNAKLLHAIWSLEIEAIKQGRFYFWDSLTAAQLINRNIVTTSQIPLAVHIRPKSEGRTEAKAVGTQVNVAMIARRGLLEETVIELLGKR